ncbi:MAG: hypothetical protein UU78_C0079G0008 [Candidatus Roizmanbacteria bacterium GW2011_GWC2_41_7]|uniref:Uncharacterized protein n=2 Tax=Candidatus Roizmaniibacteriota TaxID=1752723 RepID=A0A0G0X3Q7_9BACT|nr:MAG: hypothetical protein UU78_C0079G0008 [Candidatus Roizmanbacteria bacterium GW2011_GWC2_41_7]
MSVPIRASTQQFLEIEDIIDDLAIMVDGSCALIMETGAVNFGLLSKDEQEAIIYSFAAFLNSLSFPVQICILSKRMDISDYLTYIAQSQVTQKSEKLKEKLASYHQFILSLVKDNQVLEKRFFIVIPFSTLELGIKSSGRSLVSKPKKLPYKKDYILERAKAALYPKRDHVIRQLSRLGLKAIQLNSQALVSFFYDIYNPESSEGERVPIDVAQPVVTGGRL